MQTRKNPRKAITLPGRYFTGLGDPVDVQLTDLSTGGCSFAVGPGKLMLGSRLQIFVAGSGPHHASIKWLKDGEAGVCFAVPLDEEEFDKMQPSHIPDLTPEAMPGDFDEMKPGLPLRFC